MKVFFLNGPNFHKRDFQEVEHSHNDDNDDDEDDDDDNNDDDVEDEDDDDDDGEDDYDDNDGDDEEEELDCQKILIYLSCNFFRRWRIGENPDSTLMVLSSNIAFTFQP